MIDFDFIELTAAGGNEIFVPGTKIQVRASQVVLVYKDLSPEGRTVIRLGDCFYWVQEDVTEVLNRLRKAF